MGNLIAAGEVVVRYLHATTQSGVDEPGHG